MNTGFGLFEILNRGLRECVGMNVGGPTYGAQQLHYCVSHPLVLDVLYVKAIFFFFLRKNGRGRTK